jgi:hypothetical protein
MIGTAGFAVLALVAAEKHMMAVVAQADSSGRCRKQL